MSLALASGQTIAGLAGTASAITYTLFGDEISGPTDSFKVLGQGYLPTSAASIYAPSGVSALVRTITLCNVTAAPVTVAMYANGLGNANKIVNFIVPANGSAAYADDAWAIFDANGYRQYSGNTGAQGIQGEKGWAPIFAIVTDGARRVLQLTDWVGGQGTKPGNINDYVGAAGFTSVLANAVDIRGPIGLTGNTGNQGDKGWSPVFSVASDGNRRVLQLQDWTGGAGTKPGNIGEYVSASGFTAVIANAIDIRGPQGIQGNPGTGDVSSTLTLTAGNGLTGGGSLAANRTFDIVAADGSITVNPDSIGVGVLQSDAQHGNRGGGGIHSNVVAAGAAGFMTGADKTKLDGIAAGANVGPPTSRLINTTAPLTGGGDLSADRTLAISPATSTTAGSMAALDKKIVDNLHYDVVADFNWIGNDSNDNGAGAGGATPFSGVTSIMSQLPLGARLFFPAGTYRTSVELTINVDKRITFQGVSRYASIIKTTSATAHIFHKTVPGWYDTWIDLGFQSSVTRTGGSAIHISAANNVGMNIYRVWMTGMFHGIHAVGDQSANLSVWTDLDISSVANGGRGVVINGATINLMITNSTINAGAATNSACCEINRSGAVQVIASDWIMGTNVCWIKSDEAAGAGPQAVYFTNCFFDQPAGSVVKITGIRTANRIKFTQCGIAPTGNNHGIEFNGTGAGAYGTETALPAGISIVDCDIYSQNGSNTGAGIRLNGVGDVNIQNSRITGFNGAGGSGIHITPSAGNQTKVRINGNIIGPNSNLTVTNLVGIRIDAGASALGFLSVTDNSLLGNGTAILDASANLASAPKNINNNQGGAAGLQTSYQGAGITASTTEQIVMQIPLAANALKVGTTFRFTMSGTATATTLTVRVRIGTLGTTGDAALVQMGPTAAMIAGGLFVEGQTQVTVIGATGTHTGAISVRSATATSTLTPTVSGNFNTANALFVSVTVAAGASGPVIRTGSLDIISPS